MATEALLAEFAAQSFVVLPSLLPAATVEALNAAIDADMAAAPASWALSTPQSGGLAAGCDGELLERSTGFDALLRHPTIVELAARILGPGAQLCGFSALHREPMTEPIEGRLTEVQNTGVMATVPTAGDGADPRALSRVWHREDIGVVAGAADNEYFVPSLQAIFYLTDVGPEDHCFTIIKESAEEKRALPTRYHDAGRPLVIDDEATDAPRSWVEWRDYLGRPATRRPGTVAIHAPRGSCILFNNCSWHACTVRRTEHTRRTLHLRFRNPEPLDSAHGISGFSTVAEFAASLPPRLAAL